MTGGLEEPNDGYQQPGADSDDSGAQRDLARQSQPELRSHVDEADTDAGEPADERGAGTGNVRVDEAVHRLAELESLPTSEHADVYEDVHRRLHTALTDLDSD